MLHDDAAGNKMDRCHKFPETQHFIIQSYLLLQKRDNSRPRTFFTMWRKTSVLYLGSKISLLYYLFLPQCGRYFSHNGHLSSKTVQYHTVYTGHYRIKQNSCQDETTIWHVIIKKINKFSPTYTPYTYLSCGIVNRWHFIFDDSSQIRSTWCRQISLMLSIIFVCKWI